LAGWLCPREVGPYIRQALWATAALSMGMTVVPEGSALYQ